MDDWKDTDDLEKGVARLDSLLAAEQVTAIGDEPLRLARQGVDALKTWLRDEGWRTNVDASDEGLERGVRLLEDGWGEIERFIERMARRAFGYWGAKFFALLEGDQIELFSEKMAGTGKQDMKVLLDAEDVPDEPVDVPPTLLLTPRQRDILKALDGKALKKEDLAAKVCGASDYGNILFRPGGLKELMALGMVENTRGIGYWCTCSPPLDKIAILFPDLLDDPLPSSTGNVSGSAVSEELPY